MKKTTQSSAIQSLLDQITAINTMERGKLSAEYRTRSATGGADKKRLGPYYKLQAWENGCNVSRRVPAAEVALLKEDLANFERFNQLTGELVEEIIMRTRAQRRSEASGEAAAAISAKKNSTKKPAGKDTAKRKASSRKPRRS